ncbi:MAG TPA: Na+/H+ antiporter [Gemmatimonadaceae bacterium]|nr:Na+/H+ antiporter [Gemmatimonadaceae bacterium]
MHLLGEVQLVVLLLVATLALAAIARRLLIPYPILLVLGGLVLGGIPGLPAARIEPDLVFLVVLPPVLWAAAYFTSLRDFLANLRPITLLALGLVTATTAGVALVARAIVPDMPWAVAIALGAIVSPPDAVAATTIARQLRIPRRVVTILEGESLVNDASALVLYRTAVAAAVTGSFSMGAAIGDFGRTVVVGLVVGLAIGWIAGRALALTDDSLIETAATLVAPYAAWTVAEQLHASGVLACVAGGLLLRRQYSRVVQPAARMEARAVWDQLVFLLNALVFILIGLQLRVLREEVPAGGFGRVLLLATAVSAAVMLLRVAWVFPATWLPRALSARVRARDPMPSWRRVFLVAFTGMRGIVSLAAALALPLTIAGGAPFPYRAEIVLTTFGVILSTLVLQGLSLAPLIRWLGLEDDDALEREELLARRQAAAAALAHLEAIGGAAWVLAPEHERLRVRYAQRVAGLADDGAEAAECSAQRADAYRRLRRETLDAERFAVVALRDQGHVSDEVLHRLEHELDVEALRVGVGDARPVDPRLPAAGAGLPASR